MRIILIRHGQPQQHSDRIFLGQTDMPLSERGREEATMAGEKLLQFGARPDRIHTSDLLRARETSEIIATSLGGVPIISDPGFRELDMGIWDGELIEDIKSRYPDEYARRGKDMMSYRIPGGENFHDLRERVTKAFQRILREETPDSKPSGGCSDLVIVSHLGVIHTLLAQLTHEDETVIWQRRYPTGSVIVFDENAGLRII